MTANAAGTSSTEVALCLALFIKDVLLGKCTGISFTDSTALRVCHIKRMHSHRTFSGLAQKGKTTMGWFYGFKLHLIINDRGEIRNTQFHDYTR